MRMIYNLQKPKAMYLNVKKIKENMNIATILKSIMQMQGLQVDMGKIIHFLHFNLDYRLYLKKSNLGKLKYRFSPFLFAKPLHHLELHYPNQMGKDTSFNFVTLDKRVQAPSLLVEIFTNENLTPMRKFLTKSIHMHIFNHHMQPFHTH